VLQGQKPLVVLKARCGPSEKRARQLRSMTVLYVVELWAARLA